MSYEVITETQTQYYSKGVSYRLSKLDQYLKINRIQILDGKGYPEFLIKIEINDKVFLTDDREMNQLIKFLQFINHIN